MPVTSPPHPHRPTQDHDLGADPGLPQTQEELALIRSQIARLRAREEALVQENVTQNAVAASAAAAANVAAQAGGLTAEDRATGDRAQGAPRKLPPRPGWPIQRLSTSPAPEPVEG